MWRENAKEIIDGERMKECTFQPNIKPSSMSQMSGRKSSRATFREGGDKCTELYQKAKQDFVRKALRTDKNTQDLEFEKQKDQCTFKPSITPLTKTDLNATKYQPEYNAPDETLLANKHIVQQVERLRRGREDREWKKKFFERGIELSGTYSPSKRAPSSQRKPPQTVSSKQLNKLEFSST